MPIILQINSTANWGSTGKIAEQIGELAIRKGWQSYIAYGRNANRSKSKLIRIGSKIGMFFHLIESRLFDNHGLASRIATQRFVKEIKRINPDIIHLHNIHGYYLNYKILFNYLNSVNTPVVWTLHDCWTFTGHCAFYNETNCISWKNGCNICIYKSTYPKSYSSNSKINFNKKKTLFNSLGTRLILTPVSKWLLNEVKQSFLKDTKIVCIYNGINTNIFTQKHGVMIHNNNKLREKFVIIGVAFPWSKRKGLNDFYKLREILDPNKYEIILVGLNKEQKNNLPEGINGILRTNSAEELAELYSKANVFINPTYADTFPTTNLEALACGTPVITYRTGGSPESITPNTGFVVAPGDINGIISAIKEIEERGKEYYSEACRKYAEENFDKDKCFAKYIDLYEELLNNTK